MLLRCCCCAAAAMLLLHCCCDAAAAVMLRQRGKLMRKGDSVVLSGETAGCVLAAGWRVEGCRHFRLGEKTCGRWSARGINHRGLGGGLAQGKMCGGDGFQREGDGNQRARAARGHQGVARCWRVCKGEELRDRGRGAVGAWPVARGSRGLRPIRKRGAALFSLGFWGGAIVRDGGWSYIGGEAAQIAVNL